jgi:hypothetical protein
MQRTVARDPFASASQPGNETGILRLLECTSYNRAASSSLSNQMSKKRAR